MRIICVAIAVAAVAAVADADVTWVTWEVSAGGNGHQYGLATTGAGWETHRTAAESYGGYLATLKTEDENEWVKSNVLHLTSPHWMGLYQPDGDLFGLPDAGWRWLDGSTAPWTAWATGQPDGGTNADYAYVHGNGSWYDSHPGYNIWAVYECDEEPIPEPGTVLMVLCGTAVVALKRKFSA